MADSPPMAAVPKTARWTARAAVPTLGVSPGRSRRTARFAAAAGCRPCTLRVASRATGAPPDALFANRAFAAPDGTGQITLYKNDFIIGGSGVTGTLKFKGRQYPPSIGGVSPGATIGVSKADLVGEVYKLKNASDIAGAYTAGQASVAVAGGAKVAERKNSKGAVLKVKGAQVGLELALDLRGMEVKLKK
jgi:hypothetical protein